MPRLGALDEHGVAAAEDVPDLVVHARDAAGDHEVELAADGLLADGRIGRHGEVVVRGVLGEELPPPGAPGWPRSSKARNSVCVFFSLAKRPA